jgi:hypothetical protein
MSSSHLLHCTVLLITLQRAFITSEGHLLVRPPYLQFTLYWRYGHARINDHFLDGYRGNLRRCLLRRLGSNTPSAPPPSPALRRRLEYLLWVLEGDLPVGPMWGLPGGVMAAGAGGAAPSGKKKRDAAEREGGGLETAAGAGAWVLGPYFWGSEWNVVSVGREVYRLPFRLARLFGIPLEEPGFFVGEGKDSEEESGGGGTNRLGSDGEEETAAAGGKGSRGTEDSRQRRQRRRREDMLRAFFLDPHMHVGSSLPSFVKQRQQPLASSSSASTGDSGGERRRRGAEEGADPETEMEGEEGAVVRAPETAITFNRFRAVSLYAGTILSHMTHHFFCCLTSISI